MLIEYPVGVDGIGDRLRAPAVAMFDSPARVRNGRVLPLIRGAGGRIHQQQRAQSTGSFSLTATITAKQALAWATVEGARALGLADRIGRLEAGMQADLIVIDGSAPRLWPVHDPIATALYAEAGDVEAVMIAGHWRKRDHTLLYVDRNAVREQLRGSTAHLLPHLAG